MLTGKFLSLYDRLKEIIPKERLIHDPLRTLTYGTDASFYRLTPQLIVKVENEDEVLASMAACRELHIPYTFRAAGTSLSGQALSDSVLILLGTNWKEYAIHDGGRSVTLDVGILGAEANQFLAPYQRKIGPDPASINSAKIGGIVANNACGMSSGIEDNTLYSILGMRVVMDDGTVLDTTDPVSRKEFAAKRKDIVDKVTALSERVKADPAMLEKIRHKFTIKNTTGYSVNALIETEDPIEMIMRLMVGSEGTLGFISRVTLRTIEDARLKATSLAFFPTIKTACEAILALRDANVSAAELMDRTSLRTSENKPGMPSFLKELGPDACALLIETWANEQSELNSQIDTIATVLEPFELIRPVAFCTDPKGCGDLWEIRKGLFPAACIERELGTTVIIEDVAVQVELLGDMLTDLQELFKKYEYENTVIWGHAFDGNVHFVLTQNFETDAEIKRYQAFMEDLVELIVGKYDGSLKAEHGTGRNMAPFVAREWGDDIHAVMREIKEIFDPAGLINPGTIITDDPTAYLHNFKEMPRAHSLVDTCIECGFCERNCVSHELTLSARQRIVAYREMARLTRSGKDPKRFQELRTAYDYYGNQTCAADGLCALTCPVAIDTGKLVKHLRHETNSPLARKTAAWVGDHMCAVTGAARVGLGTVGVVHSVIGTKAMNAIASGARTISGNRIPRWTEHMPRRAKAVHFEPDLFDAPRKVVYFPSCITRSMGVAREYKEELSLTRTTEHLLHKAGFVIRYPEGMNNLCCGMPFASKGFTETANKKARELEAALLEISDNGAIPILCDTSPCLLHMKQTLDERLQLFEPIEFTLVHLAPHLKFHKVPETVAIHVTCSAQKMGLDGRLKELAEMCAERVAAPNMNCCGFAGDRGFTFPELNAHGTRNLKKQLPADCTQGYSTSRTCEIGLSEHGGITYKSILYLVDRCTE
jgi:D-lactate dehydrogenase